MNFPKLVQARHTYICDYHKQVIQCARSKQQQQRRRKDSEEDSGGTDNDLPEVDLFQLQVGTLRRYKRHYKVPTRPGLNKAQLADVSSVNYFCKFCLFYRENFFMLKKKLRKCLNWHVSFPFFDCSKFNSPILAPP